MSKKEKINISKYKNIKSDKVDTKALKESIKDKNKKLNKIVSK